MKHGIAKQHIVKTASHLFYHNGYNLTGINQIIRLAGIAKSTLYNHFNSKDEICVAYLEHRNGLFIEDLKKFINTNEKGQNRVIAIFDFLRQFYDQEDFNGCWCVRIIAELPRNNKLIKVEIQQQKADFLKLIETTIQQNIKTDISDKLAKQIYLLYEGAVSESYLHNDPWPIETARSVCKQIIKNT